jgi:hypothetical protein
MRWTGNYLKLRTLGPELVIKTCDSQDLTLHNVLSGKKTLIS